MSNEMPLKEGLYVMSGKGNKWSDYEGPFTFDEALSHMKSLVGEWASPEMINGIVMVVVKDNLIDLFKIDGSIIDGKKLYWENMKCVL